jgi:hypothetical protein
MISRKLVWRFNWFGADRIEGKSAFLIADHDRPARYARSASTAYQPLRCERCLRFCIDERVPMARHVRLIHLLRESVISCLIATVTDEGRSAHGRRYWMPNGGNVDHLGAAFWAGRRQAVFKHGHVPLGAPCGCMLVSGTLIFGLHL